MMKGLGASMSTRKTTAGEWASEMAGTQSRAQMWAACARPPAWRVCWRSRRGRVLRRSSQTLLGAASYPASQKWVLRVPRILGSGQMVLATMVCGIARRAGVSLDGEENTWMRALGVLDCRESRKYS